MQTVISNQRTAVESTTSREATLEEIPDRLPPHDVGVPTQGLWAVPIMFIAITWIVVALKRSSAWKWTRGYAPAQRSSQKLPCSNCRFLGYNSYLKCAVHPTKALKTEAMGCPDYWAQDSDRFSQ
jgi:hypothetical protein